MGVLVFKDTVDKKLKALFKDYFAQIGPAMLPPWKVCETLAVEVDGPQPWFYSHRALLSGSNWSFF